MIVSTREFVRYFRRVRRRTWLVVDRVRPDLLDWVPRAGEFSCGDIIRHLAGAERFFVTKVLEDRWTDDLDPGPALDHEATRARLREVHHAEMGRLETMPDARLAESIHDLDGTAREVWLFLMLMVEHEIHHRSQLDCYLSEAGVEPPQLYGLRMEEVLGRVAARPA